MSTSQNSRGDYDHLYKNEQGGFVRGILGFCLVLSYTLLSKQYQSTVDT